MNFIFLPVGTVCKIKNNSNKIIIIGYDNQLYYRGVTIPQGLSIDNPQILFTSSEIVNIINLGYMDSQVEQYGNSLTDNYLNNQLNRKLRITENKYKFDESGFITEDGNIKEEPKEISQYKFDESGFITEDGNIKEEPKETSQYKFDESGFIIEDGSVKEEPKKIKNYQFDENGFVISE